MKAATFRALFVIFVLWSPGNKFLSKGTTNSHHYNEKIINGYLAQKTNTNHHVSIRHKTFDSFFFGLGHFCSGSLISRNGVLTAAHCLKRRGVSSAKIVVVMGTLFLSVRDDDTIQYNVIAFFVHPHYDQVTLSHDIGYILLDGLVPINHPTVQPIAVIDCVVRTSTTCQVSGWGITEKKKPSHRLLEVHVPIIDLNVCNSAYYNELMKGQLCAGDMSGGRDACFGDSGGPLVCNGKLTGIVSSGDGCGRPNSPGVYTDVLFFYDWIPDSALQLDSRDQNVKCSSASIKRLSFFVILMIVCSHLLSR